MALFESSSSSLSVGGSEASTSNEWILEDTVEVFGRMLIGCDKFNDKKSTQKSRKEADKSVLIAQPQKNITRETRIVRYHRTNRGAPYIVPVKHRGRKKQIQTVDVNALLSVKWTSDDDVDYMKYSLLDDRKSVACGVEAARPPTPDGEVDELAEYFSHFVRVEMKMSALAESMYC